jgi:hypothetical protein
MANVSVVSFSVINDLGDELRAHDYVDGLEVEVDDALLDQMPNSLDDINDDIKLTPERDRSVPSQVGIELVAPDQLHQQAILELIVVLCCVVLGEEVADTVAQLRHDCLLVIHLSHLALASGTQSFYY